MSLRDGVLQRTAKARFCRFKGFFGFKGDSNVINLAAFKVKILEDVWGTMGPNPTVDVYYDVTFGPPPAP